jgi:hypothetical protein
VWNTYVWVADADETAGKVRAAGGQVVMEPGEVGDAGRMAVCADPAGAFFRLWQPGTHRGAAVVNEPVSLNFNNLLTRDLDGARAFYGAVFGWEALSMGEVGFWALPAYGDFLERRRRASRRPSRRSAPFRTTSQTRRRTGASPSRWTTRTPSPRGPRSSVAG